MEIYGCSKGKSHIDFIVLLVACVQTSPLPQEKSIFFLREGGRLYTGYLLGMSLHCLTLRTTKDCQKLDD